MKALLCLLQYMWPMATNVSMEHVEQLEVPKIEETRGLPLLEILDDLLEDSSYEDSSGKSMYVFSISKFNNGLRVDVHKEATGIINERLTPLGYLFSGNNIIVVNADDWLISEGYITPQCRVDGLAITMEHRNPGVIYDPDSWTYYILNGNYARYVDKIGWIWNLCNNKTNRKNLHRFLVEAPKRKPDNQIRK